MLHGIHTIFPPPRRTGHDGQDPIHQKKAKTEGSWEFVKEILGWVFDGINRCISLPEGKIAKLLELLKEMKHKCTMECKALMSLRGKLQHTTMGMPGATLLIGPIHKALTQDRLWPILTPEVQASAKDLDTCSNACRLNLQKLEHLLMTWHITLEHMMPLAKVLEGSGLVAHVHSHQLSGD